jgi:sugar/nucleoside kinase (ribokinase family)
LIVVLGDIAVDIVSRLRRPLARGSDAPAEVRVMPGGSGANVAVWLARLGQPVTFVGRVGADLFGRWLQADLAGEGVTPALVEDRGRGTGVIQVLVEPDGERTMIPDRGANAVWAEEDAAEALIAQADLLHVVGYVLLDADSRRGALAAMRHARSHGVPISLDPSSHAPLLALGVADFWGLIGRVTIVLPNRMEALALAGVDTTEAAASALLAHAELVAVKLDRDGCLAARGRERWETPAPAARIVNATGAGDAFNAAFLARWLVDRDIAAACRAGVALGTHAATLPTTR